MQVKNIANLFKLEPQSIYLAEEIENMIIFPLENGKFKLNQLLIGNTYEVYGNGRQLDSVMSLPVSTPFGAYVNPTFPPPPHPPRAAKPISIKKSIVIINVSKKKGKLDYKTVTQVVVSLTLSQCNVNAVTQLVTQQVGFQVQLLDCKCYPLLVNEGTSGAAFWRSTRKIMATSKSVYERVSGLSADMDIEQAMDDAPGPSKSRKRPHYESQEDSEDLKLILNKLSRIETKLTFLDELSQCFQCVICRSTATNPIVSQCCQRILGCEACVNTWVSTHSRCPHCSTSGVTSFKLRGFDDALKLVNGTTKEPAVPEAATVSTLSQHRDSDSDFEDP